jgi:hypothetical protein
MAVYFLLNVNVFTKTPDAQKRNSDYDAFFKHILPSFKI